MRSILIVLIAAGGVVSAQTKSNNSPLSLESYLAQVMTLNPEARAAKEQVIKAELRKDEAEVPLSSELYASYNFTDDRDEPTNPFAPSRTKNSGWRTGVRDKTIFGLGTDFYVQSNHTQLLGVNPVYIPLNDYYDTRAGVNLTQSLWRNAFGEGTRAQYALQKSKSRIEILQTKFDLKNITLRAENAYWSVVSLNQIVKLQEENVDRAKRLSVWMRKRVAMRLVDDVDGLQVDASLETRELELQASLDERAGAIRQFNTLRGRQSDEVDTLADLPASEMMLKASNDPTKRMSREDFRMIYEKAQMAAQDARGAASMIAPQLDLTAGVATNGLNNSGNKNTQQSWDELQHGNNPTWQVGLQFSIPLDYSLIGNMSRSYKAASKAAESQKEFANFAEERAWHDLVQQKSESQKRFERSIKLEKTQTELVKRERQRLLNNRTTILQATTSEQNLAMAQIQRVKSQLSLLQIHNVLKTWGAN